MTHSWTLSTECASGSASTMVETPRWGVLSRDDNRRRVIQRGCSSRVVTTRSIEELIEGPPREEHATESSWFHTVASCTSDGRCWGCWRACESRCINRMSKVSTARRARSWVRTCILKAEHSSVTSTRVRTLPQVHSRTIPKAACNEWLHSLFHRMPPICNISCVHDTKHLHRKCSTYGRYKADVERNWGSSTIHEARVDWTMHWVIPQLALVPPWAQRSCAQLALIVSRSRCEHLRSRGSTSSFSLSPIVSPKIWWR